MFACIRKAAVEIGGSMIARNADIRFACNTVLFVWPTAPEAGDRLSQSASHEAVHAAFAVTETVATPPSFAMETLEDETDIASVPLYICAFSTVPSDRVTCTASPVASNALKTGMLLPEAMLPTSFHSPS